MWHTSNQASVKKPECMQLCLVLPTEEGAVGQACCVDYKQLVFDWHFPEVDPLNERPVETLCKKGWNEVLLNSVLHILQITPCSGNN